MLLDVPVTKDAVRGSEVPGDWCQRRRVCDVHIVCAELVYRGKISGLPVGFYRRTGMMSYRGDMVTAKHRPRTAQQILERQDGVELDQAWSS